MIGYQRRARARDALDEQTRDEWEEPTNSSAGSVKSSLYVYRGAP